MRDIQDGIPVVGKAERLAEQATPPAIVLTSSRAASSYRRRRNHRRRRLNAPGLPDGIENVQAERESVCTLPRSPTAVGGYSTCSGA